MSATHAYTALPRTALGGHASDKLRLTGQVPVTISRPGKDSSHVSIDIAQARHLAANVIHLCKVTVGKDSLTALKGEIVRDCLKDTIQHIDLVEVDEKSQITVEVAIVPDARNCPGVKAGGIVEQSLRKLRVRCPANAIPDAIGVDLGETQLMQTIYSQMLKLPQGLAMVTKAKTPILSVVIPRGMKKVEEVVATDAVTKALDPKAAAAAPAAAAKPGAKPDAKAAAKPDAKKK